MRPIITICLCLAIIGNLYAQPLDSVYKVYYAVKNKDTTSTQTKIDLLEILIDRETHQSLERALGLIDTLAEIYKQTNNLEAYNKMRFHKKGFAYATNENTIEALKCYQNFAKVFKRKGLGDAYFLIDVGNLYYDIKLFNTARKFYKESELLFEEEKNYRGLTTVYGNYSLIAKNLNQFDTAYFYIQKTLEIQEKFSRDTFQIAHTYQVMGRLYLEIKKDYQAALPHFEKSIALLSDERLKTYFHYQQFIHLLPFDYMYLGVCLSELGKATESKVAFEKAISIGREIDQSYALAAVLWGAGETLLKQKIFDQSKNYLLEAEALSFKVDNKTVLTQCYKSIKELYIANKDDKMALAYSEKYITQKELLQNQEDAFLVMNDLVLQQERINTIQEQENVIAAEQQLTYRLYIILVLIAVGLFLALFFWKNVQQKNKIIASYSKELEGNNNVKEMILSVIGHDLRSLFNVLMTSSANLLKEINNSSLTLLKKDGEQVHLSSRKAYMMMDDLMQWVVLQKETTTTSCEKLQLSETITATIESLEPILQSNHVEVKVAVDNAYVHSDNTILKIILRNLLTNAIKHSPIGGIITINSSISNHQLILKVSDQGNGIDKEILDKLFVPQNHLQVAVNGGGLGLKIVQELCNNLQIGFKAYNQENSGAVFELTIPLLEVINLQEQGNISIDVAPILSKQDIEFLHPFVEELKTLELFEGTKIQRIIGRINQQNPSQAAQKWVAHLIAAINIGSSEDFDKTLNKISNPN